MSEPVFKWATMRDIQKNALVAEKIMGWQWVPYTFYDSGQADQLWLLPNAQSVADLTPGEWTYYEEDAQGQRIGNRYIPYWIPHYTTSLDAAWQVVSRVTKLPRTRKEPWFSAMPNFAMWFNEADLWANTAQDAAEEICLAALKVLGVEIEAEL